MRFYRLFSAVLLAVLAVPLARPASGQGSDTAAPTAAQPSGWFTTRSSALVRPAASDAASFQFVVYGDRTGGVPAGLKVLDQAVTDTNLLGPDLVMTVGDLVQGYNERPEWLEQTKEYQAIMNRLEMPWYPVAGNHDIYWRGPGQPPAGEHESGYEQHFAPLWYSFAHKNAGFIVLFSDEGDAETGQKGFNEGRLQTMSPAQLAFLEEALQRLQGQDHVFVFLHHPRWAGGGYRGGNWDTVHRLLAAAGNVSAVFAGHIHRMRFDQSQDGIAYYTMATTGGSLSADLPDGGRLHHLNVVTVRPDSFHVASLPVGSVVNHRRFTPEFNSEVGLAQSFAAQLEGEVLLEVDGSASGTVQLTLSNPAPQALSAQLKLDSPSGDWLCIPHRLDTSLAAGESKSFTVQIQRHGDSGEQLSLPVAELTPVYHSQQGDVRLPPVRTPLPLKLSSVPADYFVGQPNRALNVTTPASAVRVEAKQLPLADGPFTVEAWFNPAEQQNGHLAAIAKTQSSEYAIFMNEGTPQFDVHLDGRYRSARGDQQLAPGKWTHVAGVFDGEQLRIYIDGQLSGSRRASGKRTVNQLPLYIGADPDNGGRPTRPFVGKIDEVRISQTARYDDNFTPAKRFQPDADTLLLQHFDRQLGPFALDHANSGILAVSGSDTELVPAE